MVKGRVKYFNDQKGWGFISSLDTDEDVYVHYTSIDMDGYRTLREGQEVFYELTRSDLGPRASNVKLAG